MKKLKLNYGSNAGSLFELDFIQALNPVKDEVIVLVPEQFKADTEEYLIKNLGRHGLFHISVYGFGKLVSELSLRFGLQPSHLSRFGKSLLLSRILKDLRPKLEIYRTRLSKGLADHLLSVLDAFRLEGVRAEYLEELAASLMPNQTLLIKKTREMSLILRVYEEGVSGSHIDEIALIEKLIEELLSRPVRKDLNLVVEGFNGMSRQEMRLTAALSHHAGASTFINVLKSNEGVLKTYSDRLVEGLKQAFYDIGDWDFHIEEVLAEPNASNKRAALFSNIFSHKRRRMEVEGLDIIACDNREDELSFVALDILKKVREEGASWGDFSLITNSPDVYQKHIFKVLTDYKIPYFIDEKASVVDFHFCSFLVSALESVKNAFSKRAVIRFLKHSSHLELPQKRLSLEEYRRAYEDRTSVLFNIYSKLEIYARKYNIDHGMWLHSKYLDPFFKEWKDTRAEDIRFAYFGMMKQLECLDKDLKEALSFEGMLLALKKFLEKAELAERLSKLKSLYQNLGEEDAYRKLSAQELALEDLITQLDMLSSLEVGDMYEFIDLVLSALKDYEVGLPPPSTQTIVLGTAARSRLIGVKYLYLIGANEGLMPSPTPSNVFFSENEMMKLENASFTALKRSKNFLDKEVFDIFEKISFAEKNVYFTYSKHDEKNEELGPSYWLKSLANQGNLEIRTVSGFSLLEIAEAGIMDKYFDSLIMEGKGRIRPEFSDSVNLQEDTRARLHSHMETYVRSGRDIEASLNMENRRKFKHAFRNISVSKLESHAGCPFKFFVAHILKPKEMPQDTPNARELGLVMHAALERFVKAYMEAEDKLGFQREAVSVLAHFIREEAEYSPFYLYNKEERRKLELNAAYLEFMVPVLLKHFDTDLNFEVKCEYEIREMRGDFELRGVVDRVDAFDIEGTRYYRVVDYKSSNKKFSLEEFSHGTQLQLPLYLNHFVNEKSGSEEARPLGFAYFDFGEKLYDGSKKPEEAYDEEKVRSSYAMNGKFIRDVSVLSCVEKGLLEQKASSIIQSVRLKKNGDFYQNSGGLMSEAAFDELFSSLESILNKLNSSLSSGTISISPYKSAMGSGCDYCPYGNICKFDGARYRSKYRTEPLIPIPKLDSKEDE